MGAPRVSCLDGMRALAVSLVVGYHGLQTKGSDMLWYLHLPRGIFGVRIFFVISGFIITPFLLRERDQTGGISLLPFHRRRALRLLPVLAGYLAFVALVTAVT